MVVTYSTNMMGPVSMDWYRKRNLTYMVKHTILTKISSQLHNKPIGSIIEREEVKTYYAGGRIDIYGLNEEEYYCGRSEYSLPIMHGEDYNDFSSWLEDFQTHELWSYNDIIEEYEQYRKKKIRWDNISPKGTCMYP